jgi:hypothetical protein
VLAEIRAACAEVARRSRWVRLDEGGLARFAETLELASVTAPRYDAAHHYVGDPEAMLAFNLTLDAVNFGSGYFPHLRKRPGKSGYFTVALALKEHFEAHGPLAPRELVALTPPRTAALFGQDLGDPVRAELMRHFTEALHQLGSYLVERFGGSFAALVAAAQGRAERLAELLAEMPYFRDVARYGELRVPLYKRAQIAPSDLALAFDGQGYGHFSDLEQLTIFADNLVPHVLRVDGVLVYDPALVARLEAGALIPAGSEEEVEIRAVALHAAERLVAQLRAAGEAVSARQLDVYLWNRGQQERYKAAPRHRTRSVFY